METYIEQMVKKKRSKLDILLVLALALGSTVLAAFLLNLSFYFPAFGSIIFLVIAGVFYFAYMLAVSRNIEYEYAMVGSEIDIDKIANQRKRKRITTVNAKKMDNFGRCSKDSEFSRLFSDVSIKKVYACEDKDSDDTFYVVYFEDGIRKMVLFTPNQEIVDMIVKYNPREQYVI